MTCSEVLREPFNNLTSWSTVAGTTPSIVTGRTGTGVDTAPTGANIRYAIPSGSQTDTVTLGFALKFTGGPFVSDLVFLRSDSGATDHIRLRLSNLGALSVLRSVLGIGVSSANGVIAAGSWYYIELQVKLHDTTGFATVRVNGTVVASGTNIDTKNAGTKTVFDTLDLAFVSGASSCIWDDLILQSGDTCSFLGDVAVGGTLNGAGTAAATFTASATATVAAPATGSAALTFAASATATVIAVGAATSGVVFAPTAAGTVTAGLVAAATITFGAAAVGLKVLDAGASAGVSFRGFAAMLAQVRQIGTWSAIGATPVPLVSGEFTPAPGSLVVVLYALKVEGVTAFLSGWSPNGGVASAVSDTFAGHEAWHSFSGANHSGTALPDESWLVAIGYTRAGSAPGPGRVTVTPESHPGMAQYAVLTVMEVRNWTHAGADWTTVGAFTGAWAESHHFPGDGAQTVPAAGLGTDNDQLVFGLMLSDAADVGPSATEPRWWRNLDHRSVSFGATEGATVRAALFRMGDTDTEAVGTYTWSALPLGGYNHLAVFMAIPEADVATPEPGPFAEFLVEFLDASGAWVDITCDTRTADINHSRGDIMGSFDAANLTLTMANFEGIYSPWPGDSVWDQAGRYRVDVPIRVNMVTEALAGGVIVRTPHPLFTGTTDAINDSWPGTTDAMVTITASDGFKQLTRFDSTATKDANGHDVEVGFGESTGQRIDRWATAAGWDAPDPALPDTALDFGVARMASTTMAATALNAMQDAAFAEGLGVVYCRADGVLCFRQRDAVTTDPHQVNVQATFTDRDDNPPGACYSDIAVVVDETTVYNIARMASKGDTFGQESRDADSIDWFGPRTYPPQTDLGLHEWFQDAAVATLIVYTHAHDEKRVDQVTIHPGFDQRVWDVAAALTLLDRVRVVRHFPGGYVLDEQLLIQGVHHRFAGTGERVPGNWDVTYDTVRAIPLNAGVTFCKWDRGHWDRCAWGL